MSKECAEFLEQIRHHFDYLFDQYGFAVVRTDEARAGEYCLVFLKSDHGLIRFEKELDSVDLLFGPLNAPIGWEHIVHGTRYWYPIRSLLAFLKREHTDLEKVLRRVEFSLALEEQLEELSSMLRPVCDQVLDLFRYGTPAPWQMEYEKYRQEQDEAFRKQYEERLARGHK